MDKNVLIAFGLTLFAGMATGIGSVLAFFTKRTDKKILSFSLGFSAGVMVYISFVELLAGSMAKLSLLKGQMAGSAIAIGAFFCGMIVMMVIDLMVPEAENPHEPHAVEEMQKKKHFVRMGKFTALAIALHNFPEGLATFIVSLDNFKVGLLMAIAVAIHNIPEGVSISVPIYFATGSKRKAFWLSFLCGLSEFLGAVLGYTVLRPFLTESVLEVLLAGVAGTMVYISLDELLPAAREFGTQHNAILGVIAGMAVMAFSLILMA